MEAGEIVAARIATNKLAFLTETAVKNNYNVKNIQDYFEVLLIDAIGCNIFKCNNKLKTALTW